MTKQLLTLMGIFTLLVAAMATSVSVSADECIALGAGHADSSCQILEVNHAGR